MARRTYENQDLRGKTLRAVSRHARRSLFRSCQTEGLTLVGDWRGTEYYDLTGAVDWRKAQTYGSYWRGNRNLEGSQFPADIGELHHEPVAEIMRATIAALPAGLQVYWRTIGEKVKGDTVASSWDTMPSEWYEKAANDGVRANMVSAARSLYAPYPNLATRFEKLVEKLQTGAPRWSQKGNPLATTVGWSDGFTFALDLTAGLPPGAVSLYDLDRYIFAQTGRLSFTYSAVPLKVMGMQVEGNWLDSGRWKGY